MDFETFILKQMKRAGVGNDAKTIFRTNEKLFRRAFTHKSESVENYDMLEAFGDKILNACLFDIMHELYPNLNQGTITLAFQKAKSEEIFSLEGEREGFFDHIIMSDEYKHDCLIWKRLEDNNIKYSAVNGNLSACLDRDLQVRMKNPFLDPTHDTYNLYKKVLEDTIESFCGALCKAVNTWTGLKMGPGSQIVYDWAVPLAKNLPFDCTNTEETRNIKQQMKEFWDTVYAKDVNEKKKMTNHMMYWHDKKNSRPGQVVMHATDPNPQIRGKRPILGSVIGPNINLSRLYVAQMVFPIIKEKYAKQYEEGMNYKPSKN